MVRKELYVVDGYRTPFAKFNTDLSDEPAFMLGSTPAKLALAAAALDPADIDEVIFGCCNQPGNTLGNISRLIALRSGVPEHVPAVTVHRNCASGFEAITYAHDKARAGRGDVFLVGGVESMSQAPFLFNKSAVKKFTKMSRSRSLLSTVKSATAFRPSDFSPEVSLKLALVDSTCDMNMGETAELLAREYNISRTDQDEFSVNSHMKAAAAKDLLSEEISPFYTTIDNCIRSHTGNIISNDNGVRDDSSVDKLGRLKTVFDRNGTVTPGNASQVTDGGVALLLMTDQGLAKTKCTPIARIVDYAYAGCDPRRMGLGPIKAIEKLSRCTGLPGKFKVSNMDVIELNEAFAAQTLACQKLLDIPDEKLNVNGGAIALGHPLAATGARLILTLAKQLNRSTKCGDGLATLCVGGGQGGAIWIKSL